MGRSVPRFVVAAMMLFAAVLALGRPAHAQYPPEAADCGTRNGAGDPTTTFSRGALFGVACSDLPPSSDADVLFIQSRVLLGSGRVDADGDFTFTGRIPADARSGSAAIRVEADGESVTIPIRIRGAVAGAVLPTTGADVAGLGAWGSALLALGYVLVAGSRRRLRPATGVPLTFILPQAGESFEDVVPPLRAIPQQLEPMIRGEYAPERHLCEADILDLPPG